MALTADVLNAAVDGAVAVDATVYAAIHSDATSGTQTSNERVALTWGAAAAGAASVSNVPLAFTGVSNDPATHLGLWSASTAGTFRGAAPLTGDQTFNADGDYSVTAVTMTATDATA